GRWGLVPHQVSAKVVKQGVATVAPGGGVGQRMPVKWLKDDHELQAVASVIRSAGQVESHVDGIWLRRCCGGGPVPPSADPIHQRLAAAGRWRRVGTPAELHANLAGLTVAHHAALVFHETTQLHHRDRLRTSTPAIGPGCQARGVGPPGSLPAGGSPGAAGRFAVESSCLSLGGNVASVSGHPIAWPNSSAISRAVWGRSLGYFSRHRWTTA